MAHVLEQEQTGYGPVYGRVPNNGVTRWETPKTIVITVLASKAVRTRTRSPASSKVVRIQTSTRANSSRTTQTRSPVSKTTSANFAPATSPALRGAFFYGRNTNG